MGLHGRAWGVRFLLGRGAVRLVFAGFAAGSFVSCAVGVRVGLRPAPFGVLGGRCALGCLVCRVFFRARRSSPWSCSRGLSPCALVRPRGGGALGGLRVFRWARGCRLRACLRACAPRFCRFRSFQLRAPLAGVCFVGCPWVGWVVWVLPLLLAFCVLPGVCSCVCFLVVVGAWVCGWCFALRRLGWCLFPRCLTGGDWRPRSSRVVAVSDVV